MQWRTISSEELSPWAEPVATRDRAGSDAQPWTAFVLNRSAVKGPR